MSLSMIAWRIIRYVSFAAWAPEAIEIPNSAILSEMHSGLSLLEPAGSLLHLRHSILRLNLMASIFTEDSAFSRFRRWHGRVYGDLAFFFYNPLDIRNQVGIFFA